MCSDVTEPLNDMIVTLATPKTEKWNFNLESYKIEVDKLLNTCDIAHQSFQEHLTKIKGDITRGYQLLEGIQSELNVMKKCGKLDNTNAFKINSSLMQLLALFASTGYQNLEDKSKALHCRNKVNSKLEAVHKTKSALNKVALFSLSTAGLGFAGFATAVGVSVKTMLIKDLKSSVLLGLSTGGLFLASMSQIAEYFYFKNSYNGFLHDFSHLQKSSANLLMFANKCDDKLAELIEQVGQYSKGIRRDSHLIQQNSVDPELFPVKYPNMVKETEALVAALARMEAYTDKRSQYLTVQRSNLLTKCFGEKN